MSETHEHREGHDVNVFVVKAREHRFFLMIVGSVGIALTLVAVSLTLYHRSGTAQLDLSRPGYLEIRKALPEGDNYKAFPSSGPLDSSALKKFETQYDRQLKKIQQMDTFSGDPLSLESLQIASPSEEVE